MDQLKNRIVEDKIKMRTEQKEINKKKEKKRKKRKN